MIAKGKIVAAVLLLGAAMPLGAQQAMEQTVGVPPAPPPSWKAPRTAWGDPDLRGTYPLDGRPQIHGDIKTWLGSSRGHFEGDTLVVETTNFNGLSPMVIVGPSNGTSGIPTSPSMKIVEHFTPTSDGLYYEAWVEDPVVLTGPFKIGYPWKRNNDYQPFEYACHEGNTLVIANIR